MAKSKRKKRKPGYTPPPQELDMEAMIGEIESLQSKLADENAGPDWGALQRLLVKAKVDPSTAAHIVIGRDLDALAKLIAELRDPSLADESSDGGADDEPEALPEVPDETLREAMKAFRKRLKLTKLDHESKLGRNPLTTGKPAEFESIIPPHQYPRAVWEALVQRGELEATGQGFYKLPTIRPQF